MLEVRLLGAFEIKCDGRNINLPSRPAQSLFAYLLLNSGVPHRREKLAGIFWPDSTEARARASLRHELWRIRQVLAAGGAQAALITDDFTVALAPGRDVRLDLSTWQSLPDDACADDLQAVLDTCRGELLPGFYDDWVASERELVQSRLHRNFRRLLHLLEDEQRWDELVVWAERWIAQDGNPEAAYRALMLAYSALNDRPKLRAAFGRCEEALRRLELEPSAELRELVKSGPPSSNLPTHLSSFIGRTCERPEVAGLLQRSRLVTLTGSGGVGKTRLAIEIGRNELPRFMDGVWFVSLAALQDPEQVAETVRSTLHLRGGAPEASSADRLRENLASRSMLLILDNCEHVAAACVALVELLLDGCPDLRLLVTSREPLAAQDETTYRVPSLELPPAAPDLSPASLAACASVQLFTERARARVASFSLTNSNVDSVASICRSLDGIPLAIELAAGRLGVISVESLAAHLNERFDLLTGGYRNALPRHRTLRAMIDWSYDSLSEREKTLFRRLGVFTGGFTLEAAQQITTGERLAQTSVLSLLPTLVEKSLVEYGATGDRYRLLETVRMYALERLRAAGEEHVLRLRHYEYFLAMAEQCEIAAATQGESAVPLAHEHENVLAALKWCETADGGARLGLQLVGAARFNWMILGRPEEGFGLAQRFLDMPESQTRDSFRRRALFLRAHMGGFMSRFDEAKRAALEALSIANEIGDRRGVAQSLYSLSDTCAQLGEEAAAAEHARQGLPLARELNLKRLVPGFLTVMGDMHRLHRDFAAAEPLYREAVELSRRASNQDLILYLLETAILEAELGDLPAARSLTLEALEIAENHPYGGGFASAPFNASAGILGASGDMLHAAMAFGAGEKQSESDAFALSRADKAFLNPVQVSARADLGESRFQQAWAEGRALSADQVWSWLRRWLEACGQTAEAKTPPPRAISPS